jgi:hypothetical protein
MLNTFIFVVVWLRVLRNVITAAWIFLELLKCLDIIIIIIITIIIIIIFCCSLYFHQILLHYERHIPDT